MKKIFLLFAVLLFLTGSITFSQNPHFTRDYDGIPVISQNGDWHLVGGDEAHYDSMKTMGVSYFWNTITDISSQMGLVENKGFKIIPVHIIDGATEYNWIGYYCDAKYSVWEAEGTDTVNVGKATLERSTLRTDLVNGANETYIRTKPFAPDTTIMWGPYYYQEINYLVKAEDDTTQLRYDASYRLKLEHNPYYQQDTTADNPNDEICKILVTQSRVAVGPWRIDSTITIDSMILYRSDFPVMNQFYDKTLTYDLLTGFPVGDNLNMPRNLSSANPDSMGRFLRENIEFKVEWSGSPKYLLSVDKVTVSDGRGRQIIDPNSQARDLVELQLNQLSTFEDYVAGWHGIDEPFSIDIFEPIRIVAQILKDNSQQLYLTFMGFWFGVWDNPNNPYGSNHLSPHKEFFMRTNGLVNIWQNIYMYDQPFKDTSYIDLEYWGTGGYKVVNIKIAANNYSLAYSIDSLFGVSLQTSAQENVQSHLRDQLPHEVLYNANLALMYGAKFFDLYTYWQQGDSASGLTFTGMVNAGPTYTDKWYMWRDVLKPRLNGPFGKTIKNLVPGVDLLNINPSVAYDNVNINYLRKIELVRDQGTEALNSYVDLKFFNNSGEYGDNYFMIINRWYSEPGFNRFRLKLKNLSGVNNWNLKNFMDSTNTTLLPDQNGNVTSPTDTILVGDAILYSIKPVVTDGGTLLEDEYAGEGMILNDDMIISNNATLTINGTYFAKANITVKSGSKIVAGTDGKIVFDPGKGIIIDGSAEIKGTSNNRLVLEFHNSTEVGIYVPTGKSLNITYSDICKAKIGVKSESPASLTISNVNIDNCFSTGIVVVSVLEPLQAPYIKNCNITNSGMGVSVTGTDEIVIKQNNIYQCNRGMMLINVNSAYISGNSIIGKSLPNGSVFAGIYLQNTGGYLRNNTIKFHSAGVHLASSSPDMGVNEIVSNKFFGLYVDYGSYPNLVKRLANPSCWYPIGGCNIIQNNGIYDGISPENQEDTPFGSEIYLNHSDVQLSGGENEISDDREGIPAYLTIPLIKGSSVTREVIADYNYWGIVGPSQNRFGSLNVVYDPTSDFCMLPAAPCSGGNEIVIQTSDGSIVDTLESRQRESAELSDLEELYAMADKLFYSGDIEGAQAVYQQIINGQYSNEEKFYAYKKLYDIGEILREEDGYFIALQDALNSILAVETDTLLLKAFGQRSILCDVSRQEYISAIEKFDNIIQQNPNSTEAVYAEIDILTTALYLDTTSTQLGKMNGGKYLV